MEKIKKYIIKKINQKIQKIGILSRVTVIENLSPLKVDSGQNVAECGTMSDGNSTPS